MTKRKSLIAGGLVLAALALVGCSSQAETASYNLSKEADSFKVERRIIFVNGITDEYLLEVVGRCSIDDDGNQLEVTCKVADGDDASSFKKHFLGLSDNVTYFAEQTDAVEVDEYRYSVIFKPESILPSFDLQTSADR